MDLVTKQREERKQRILDVARRLIAERGYDGVTMRELADESLVSVPTLYNLFGGKDELLYAAVEAYFLSLVGPSGRDDAREGLSRLLSISETLSVQVLEHAAYARSLMGFFGGASKSTLQLRDFVARELTQDIADALRQMQSKRQLVAWVDIAVLAERLAGHIIMTSFEWAAHLLDDERVGPVMVFGTSAMVLGFARGKAVTELEAVIRTHQAAAAAGAPALQLGGAVRDPAS